MRNTILMIALCSIGTQLTAQKIDTKEVPPAVKAGLTKSMNVKDAKWDKEDNNYEANFKKDGKEMSAVFDASGALLETEVEITKAELPTAAQALLKKEYADFKLEEVAKTTAKDKVTYEAEVEKGEQTWELIFDAKGNLLKKEQEKEEGDDKD